MNGPEIVNTLERLIDNFDSMSADLYELHTPWRTNQAFLDSDHVGFDTMDAAPEAGDLDEGEIRIGDGTGPNGNDELFWSADGETVARVEADATIE